MLNCTNVYLEYSNNDKNNHFSKNVLPRKTSLNRVLSSSKTFTGLSRKIRSHRTHLSNDRLKNVVAELNTSAPEKNYYWALYGENVTNVDFGSSFKVCPDHKLIKY